MLKIYGKLTKALNSLRFFTTHEWRFVTENMQVLHGMMALEDQKTFNFNVKDINWQSYIGQYCLGIRKYVMKDDLSTLPAARKHVRK